MIISNAAANNKPIFLLFIWKERSNRKYLLIGLGLTLLQFIIFKILYPYPDFFSDSYSYIYAAALNLNINIWPIGYSKFLRLFHFISPNDTALVGFQYLLMQASLIYLYFTYVYFFPSRNSIKLTLFTFLLINPLSLYISNYINSDCLFAALSIAWFAQLIWIIHKPQRIQILTHAVILILAFTVRNNAYYYPIISAFSFFISGFKKSDKIIGISAPIIIIITFIIFSQNEAKKITGTPQFSLFTGWQLANNALYIYDKIPPSSNFRNEQDFQLDSLAKSFYKGVPNNFKANLYNHDGNFFIQKREAPLKQYYSVHFKQKDNLTLAAWGKASAVYYNYGKNLILQNPYLYIKYFCVPNFVNYLFPPLEKLKVYNMGIENISPVGQFWFKYKTAKVHCFSPYAQSLILQFYPAIFLIINISLIIGPIVVILKRDLKDLYKYKKVILLGTLFMLLNSIFITCVTINVLRYQTVPMFIGFTTSLIFIEVLKEVNKKNEIPEIVIIKNKFDLVN